MTPIISPWFIYVIMVADSIKTLVTVGAICFGVTAFVLLIVGIIEVECAWDEKERKKGKSIRDNSRQCVLPFLVSLVLAIFIPSKSTIIAMYVTQFVTTDNVTKAIEAGGNFKDVIKEDIIEIIEAMKGEEKSDATK